MNLPNTQKLHKNTLGFTLIELVVVIGMLAILFAITLIAINPAQQFQDARNAQRRSDVNAILNAIHQYAARSSTGSLPPSVSGISADTPVTIGNGTGQANLCADLVPDYIADIPRDPSNGTISGGSICSDSGVTYNANYQITRSANNRITVTAPSAEGGATISVTR